MPDTLDRLQRTLAGRYRIEREIGRGGMATVYRAEDLKHARPVAIKVLRFDRAMQAYEPERFLREIRIAATLTHPHILPLLDSGTIAHGGGMRGPYYVAPLMEGESLRERLEREKQLPLEEAIRIAVIVAGALDYAHRHDVLHRDVKPENILLHDGQPIIADFGIARAISAAGAEGVSSPGVAIGTPSYMSPEQASADRALDGRSDLYALACVVYEMLAGRPPFSGTGALTMMAQQIAAPVPPLRLHRPGVPAVLEQVLERALAKDPAARFATTAEFGAALTAALGAGTGPALETASSGARAIAVLPFVNASPDPDNEYFSDGMTDELINALGQVEGLVVASRTSVFALKGRREDVRTLGALLGVSVVLEGTVRKAGRQLRIAAQLSSVADGRLLWAERFDRELRDVFAIQDEIARHIVETLRSTLLPDVGEPVPKRYTSNLTAYNLYLKGRFLWNTRTPEGIAEGIRYFQRAIEPDPDYALAYTGLADSHALQIDYRGAPVAEGMERARAEARTALALDESLAEAHTSLAWVTFIYDWDWETAERHFRRAVELNPRYATARQWYAWLLIALGRRDAALVEGRRSVELDPASVSIRRTYGWLCYYARLHEPAVEQLRRAITMNPTSEESHRVLGLAYLQQGRYDEAEVSLREAVASSDEHSLALAALAQLAGRRGRREQARALLAGLEARAGERYVSPVALVMAYLAVGATEEALDWLERARVERRGWLVYLRVDPLLDPLHDHPRFRRLVEQMRLG